METLNDDELRAWLRIGSAELAPIKLRALLGTYDYHPEALLDDAEFAWRSRAPEMTDRQIARLTSVAKLDVNRQMDKLHSLNIQVVTYPNSCYPANLRNVPDAPPLLFARGELVPDDRFSVAIVGSRRASSYGLMIAERFANELSRRGLCVVSGGARGVDTRAHRGALNGGGRTLAYVGCGLDVIYPAENKNLYNQISEAGHGAVVSEFVPGITPEPWRFPARNRLISGTVLGVLVIESPLDSGAMITATDAANQGRDVFAVPGPIGSGKSSGCHKLIQEGAKLVESPDDIFTELGLLPMAPSTENTAQSLCTFRPAPPTLDPVQQTVIETLSLEAQHVDQIIGALGLKASAVNQALTMLEMSGLARRVPGNCFVRAI